jgi:Holliday junction DNA helicase RuvA
MIAYLDGNVIEVDDEKCILDVKGVGYSVFSSRKTLKELGARIGDAKSGLPARPNVKLFTRLIHRDDCMELYGFLSRQENTFFNLLITVNGIGPKNALKILGACEVPEIAGAIVSENSSFLKSIAGIGEKKAVQIILQLKEKIKKLLPAAAVPVGSSYLDAIALLESLGFSKSESKEAVDKAQSALENDSRARGDVEKIVETALRSLSDRK